MFRTLVMVLFAFASFVVHAETTFDSIRAKAMKGDYQAQRNLAFGYASSSCPGQDKNPMLACAWRYVIIKSGSERVDQTDINNFKLDCGKLEPVELQAAEAQAANLLKKIK